MLFRLDANYQGKYRALPNPTIETLILAFGPYKFTKARTIFNGRVALRDIRVGPAIAEVALWGRSLSNNKDVLYQLQFGDFELNSSYQPARTYGVDFIFKLGPSSCREKLGRSFLPDERPFFLSQRSDAPFAAPSAGNSTIPTRGIWRVRGLGLSNPVILAAGSASAHPCGMAKA